LFNESIGVDCRLNAFSDMALSSIKSCITLGLILGLDRTGVRDRDRKAVGEEWEYEGDGLGSIMGFVLG